VSPATPPVDGDSGGGDDGERRRGRPPAGRAHRGRAPSGERRASGQRAAGGSRREARERALGLLYEAETKGVPAAQVVDAQPVPPDTFAVDLATGVGTHKDELDDLIRRFARGWRPERMPVLDLVLLRMGAFELAHRPDVPTAAAISEAVDLARRFSTDDSGRFVNGVLARIAEELRPGDARPAPDR